ncbi:hypothetical protein BGX38DRAFT_1272778 [Terfezia claveryi]|nr:hypothetical protein BGX38DRAFT_1272778 [Terfezia claveryi]
MDGEWDAIVMDAIVMDAIVMDAIVMDAEEEIWEPRCLGAKSKRMREEQRKENRTRQQQQSPR